MGAEPPKKATSLSKRKQCMVYVTTKGHYMEDTFRCREKIKPGTPFCQKHFETHKLVKVECNGEAHSNPHIDHCMVCLPFWGEYPEAVKKDAPGVPWERGSWE